MNRFIFVTVNGLIYQYAFYELKSCKNVFFTNPDSRPFHIENKFMKAMNRLHYSKKMNKIIKNKTLIISLIKNTGLKIITIS